MCQLKYYLKCHILTPPDIYVQDIWRSQCAICTKHLYERGFEYMQMFCSAYSMWCTIFPSGYLHVSLIMYCISVWIYADVLYNVLNSHFNIEYMQMYCAMYSMYVWIYANVLCRILGIQHPALPLIYSKCHSCHYLTEDWSHTWP